jgi:hypothetical protein
MVEVELAKLGKLVASAKNAKHYRFIVVPEGKTTAADLQHASHYKGPDLVLEADVPDSGGKAVLDLGPRREELEKKIAGLGPDAKLATFILGFPGAGDENGKAEAGPTLHIVGHKFLLHLEIDPHNHDAVKDHVTLKGADGSTISREVVRHGKKNAHKKGMATIEFAGVKPGVAYTCTVEPQHGAKAYKVFVNRVLMAK